MSNLFIRIEVDKRATSVLSLAGTCPVNIFAVENGQVVVQVERQDECTLCELCLKAAPPGSIRIHKLYSSETLVHAAA
jgi:NAD-dependent dihydropyrimidine dehydrogenase PreA subunit